LDTVCCTYCSIAAFGSGGDAGDAGAGGEAGAGVTCGLSGDCFFGLVLGVVFLELIVLLVVLALFEWLWVVVVVFMRCGSSLGFRSRARE
jgi:hypothetical protein